jgi:protein tyrosine/serine phosphatase
VNLSRFWILGIFGLLLTQTSFAEFKNFYRVDSGLYRGSKPVHDEDFEKLKNKYGIRTLLDLRMIPFMTEITKGKALEHGLNYVNIPIIPITTPSKGDMESTLNIMMDPALRPVYVYCLLGEDRTGLAVALYRIHAQHYSKEFADEEMQKIGFKEDFLRLLYKAFTRYSPAGALDLKFASLDKQQQMQDQEQFQGQFH